MVGLRDDIHGRTVMALRPSSRIQNLSIGASSVASTVFLAVNQNTLMQDAGTLSGTSGPSGTTHVRLVSTVDCYVLFGQSPTVSSTTGLFLPASSPEYFPVEPLDQIAVIQSAAGGTLNVVECW